MKTLTALQKGQRLFLKGDLPGSIKAFSTALEKDRNSFAALLGRGVAYLKTVNLEHAMTDFEAAVALGKDPSHAYFYRGIVHLNKREYHDAIEDLTEAIRFNPERGVVYLARGLAHGGLEHKNEARADLETAYTAADTDIATFIEEYTISRDLFDRTVALFDYEGGPWKMIMTDDEIIKMYQQ